MYEASVYKKVNSIEKVLKSRGVSFFNYIDVISAHQEIVSNMGFSKRVV